MGNIFFFRQTCGHEDGKGRKVKEKTRERLVFEKGKLRGQIVERKEGKERWRSLHFFVL
jgi:hypothetical protein